MLTKIKRESLRGYYIYDTFGSMLPSKEAIIKSCVLILVSTPENQSFISSKAYI